MLGSYQVWHLAGRQGWEEEQFNVYVRRVAMKSRGVGRRSREGWKEGRGSRGN